jgi:hypothetical protein
MNTLVCGTRGTGKSTLALKLANDWGGTVVIFDPRGSYASTGVQCATVDELIEHLRENDYVDDEGVAVPLVFHPDADPEESFTQLCAALFPPQFVGFRGRIALLVDESRNLQGPNSICPALDRLVGQAPRDDVLVIQTTHEIKEWNSKSKSVMDEVYLFYQVGPQNYDRIADLCGDEVAETVQGFKPRSRKDPILHHCVHYSFREQLRDDGESWVVIDDPRQWYIPLGEQNRLPGNRVDRDCQVTEDG